MNLLGNSGRYLCLPVLASLDMPLVVFPDIEDLVFVQEAGELVFSSSDSTVPARKQVFLLLPLPWSDYAAVFEIPELLALFLHESTTLYNAINPLFYCDRDDLSPALTRQRVNSTTKQD